MMRPRIDAFTAVRAMVLLAGLCTACVANEDTAAQQDPSADGPTSRAQLVAAASACPVWFLDEESVRFQEVRDLSLGAQPALSFSQAARLALDHRLIARAAGAPQGDPALTYQRVYAAALDARGSPAAAIRSMHGLAQTARTSSSIAPGPCLWIGQLLL